MKLLIVDDDPGVRELLLGLAADQGWPAQAVGSGQEGLASLRQELPTLLLLDLGLPDGKGIDFLREWRGQWPSLASVVITGDHEVDTAVDCMRLGAFDYVTKPFALQELLGILRSVLHRSELEAEARRLREALENGRGLQRLLGGSKSMEQLRQKLQQVAAYDVGVLLRGESGTGKEAAAEAIHALSPRKDAPFVSVDCGALPGSLLEAELFGHEKGAFTGAVSRKKGRVELAQGGVLFLDEVGNLPPALQPKLLRFLQQRNFQRLGGQESITADLRLIAATNVDLRALVEAGRFRQDLYYRLAEMEIVLPPLRERGGDVVELARAFALSCSSRFGRPAVPFSDAALDALRREAWPGNVRQLLNAVRSACLLADQSIEPSHLSLAAQAPVEAWQGEELAVVLAREKHRVEGLMLSRAMGDGSRPLGLVAKSLDIDVKTLNAVIERQKGGAA